MKHEIILNVKNDLVYRCGIINGDGTVTPAINFIEHLRTLSFSDVCDLIKKRSVCARKLRDSLVQFDVQCDLRHAVRNNTGMVEFIPKRFFTSVILRF